MINKKKKVIVQLIYIFRLLIEFINVYEICTLKVIYIFILWSNWDSCIAIIIHYKIFCQATLQTI